MLRIFFLKNPIIMSLTSSFTFVDSIIAAEILIKSGLS